MVKKSIEERIVFFGRNKNYQITLLCYESLLKKIKNTQHELILTVISDDNHGEPNTLEDMSEKARIPWVSTFKNNVNHPNFIKKLALLNPTLFITVQFPKIYSESLLKVPVRGSLNVHRGWPLRGGSIDERAIYYELPKYYVILHHMTTGIDDGNMIGKIGFVVNKKENGYTLVRKSDLAGKQLFEKYFLTIIGKKIPKGRKQNIQKTVYANKGVLSNHINFYDNALKIEKLCRAFHHPRKKGAVTNLAKKMVSIKLPITIINKKSSKKPGTIISLKKNRVDIATSDKVISIKKCYYNEQESDFYKILSINKFHEGDVLKSFKQL